MVVPVSRRQSLDLTVASDRLKELFAEAIALNASDRPAFVAALRREDAHLADDLDSLLAAHERAGAFLTGAPQLPILLQMAELSSQVGPYRIIRLLGRGGMGEVYEAESTGEHAQGRVALKIIRAGTLTPELLRRFTLERRTLARLDHPNIARLLDGGTTDDGTPYLAMEFVEGERIDEYLNRHNCSVDQRLALFLTVCGAVQYAHGRLVIHRDLKPNNILVRPDGVPKLLDFGIAKLLAGDDETAAPYQTRTMANIFTPEFASPEQVRGREITTASDVYSLGLLLYVLLTGQRPYDVSTTTLQELPARLQQAEPQRPSSQPILIESPEGKSRVRRRLRGDLDTIILTALEKEPSKRYVSVQQFAEDIQRHISHLPIQAQPAPLGRRFVKLLQRNRLAAGIAAFILVGLVAGLLVARYQMKRAEAQKERADKINLFLRQILTYTNPENTVGGSVRNSVVMEDVLDDAARRLESDEFTNEPEVRVQLERILGDAYVRQGRYDQMYEHYRKCIQLWEEYPGMREEESLDTLFLRAMELFARGKLPQSEDLYRKALPKMREVTVAGKMKVELYAEALNNFGYLRRTQGDSREAEAAFREVLDLVPRFQSDPHFITAVTRSTLASVLADQGRFDEGLRTAEAAVAEGRNVGIASTPGFGFVLTIYGGFLVDAGRLREADSLLSEAAAVFQQLLTPGNLWAADNLRIRASLQCKLSHYDTALAWAGEAARIYRTSFGTHYDTYPVALSIEGLSYEKLGKRAEAERVLREAVDLRHQLMPPGHFFTALAEGALGEVLTDQHRYAEAETLLVRSHADLLRSQGPDNPRTILARRRLRELYTAWRRPEDAARFGP
jgi:eukaryotic-like serine/threonine-protein kinase